MQIQQKAAMSTVRMRFHSLIEFFQLFWINLMVQKRSFIEFLKVAYYYYRHLPYCKIDFSLLMIYLFNSPFAVSKKFLQSKGEKEVYAYGETPLTTLDKIAHECHLSFTDTVFELGCGRGRTCFWLKEFIQCKVVGIDFVPEFIERAELIKNRFQVVNVEFRLGDLFQADLREATVIYLYGTSLESDDIKKLIEKFKKLPSGTKIITVSYPLSDYTHEPIFEVMNRFEANFTWGSGDVYMQVKL